MQHSSYSTARNWGIVTVDDSPQLVGYSNVDRREFIICNNSADKIYFCLGNPEQMLQGNQVPLYPGDKYALREEVFYTGPVSVRGSVPTGGQNICGTEGPQPT